MLIRDCIEAASRAFNVSTMDIARQDRSLRTAHPRFAAMYMARRWGFTFPRIGQVMGRDHSTVMHGARRACQLATGDEDYALKLTAAMQEVGLV